jgi:hypothetical protein
VRPKSEVDWRGAWSFFEPFQRGPKFDVKHLCDQNLKWFDEEREFQNWLLADPTCSAIPLSNLVAVDQKPRHQTNKNVTHQKKHDVMEDFLCRRRR